MNPKESTDKTLDTDILIIGGGLAGCLAAIEARKRNLKVTLLEKAAMNTGGAVGVGLDHYPSIAHPMINDITPEQYARWRSDELEGLVSFKKALITSENVLKPIPVLESIGIKIHERDGSFIMQSGRVRHQTQDLKYRTADGQDRIRGDYLWYKGADTKFKLADAVRKAGVKVFERTMLASLITENGRCIGATGVNVRDGSFMAIMAKCTLLTTGGAFRLYTNPHAPYPLNLFIQFATPQCCGGGIAAAYEAGAQVINMEYGNVGPSWKGLPRDSGQLMAILTKFPKMVDSSNRGISERYALVGTNKGLDSSGNYVDNVFDHDVFFTNYDGATDEQFKAMEPVAHRMNAIGPPYMLELMQAQGGLGKVPVEKTIQGGMLNRNVAGVLHDERGESSLKGLFIAGDVGGGIPGYGASAAFTWAMRCAEFASEEAAKSEAPKFDKTQKNQIEATRERFLAPLKRKDGVNPIELENIVRTNNDFYVGHKKVGPKLKRNIELLRILKEQYVPALVARNPHELMRCIEVQSAMTVSDLHTNASLTRTETRKPPGHYRVDYPKKDDVNWKKSIVWQNVGGKMEYTFKIND